VSVAGRLARLRLLSPVGLLLALYLALAALYAWQAWRRETPTIFTDELELTQLSRSIAETGSPARRGSDYERLASLYAYLTAPAWWLPTVSDAFGAIKLLGVLVMTGAMLPAYGLARLAVGPGWALAAAALTGAAPALSYAPFLVEEPLAYLTSTLALYLIARFALQPSWTALIVSVGGCMVGAWSRTQLVVLFPTLLLVVLAVAWRTERFRRYRATWTRWDWVGAGVLAVGALMALSAFMGHRSQEWYVSTLQFKDRMLEYGLWAAGALTIGLGVVPLVAGLAALVPPRGETLTPGRRAYVTTAVAAIVCYGWYTGIKAAWISATFSLDTVERNLIYLVPVLAVGTALLLERRAARWWAVLATGGLAVYLVTTTPLSFAAFPNYNAHGLAIASLPNRLWSWTFETVETTLLWVALVATALVLAVGLLRRRPRLGSGLAVAVVGLTVAWSLTAQVYAADAERDFSDRMADGITRPFDWIDRTVDGADVVVFGQQLKGLENALWLTEFWNRSITRMWSVDGSAPGPGPTLTPDLGAPDGTLTPAPGTSFALALPGVELQGPVARTEGTSRIVRLDGGPLRLAEAVTGIYSDGWMGDTASMTRYTAPARPSFLKVTLSRTRWCPGKKELEPSAVATVRVGPVAVVDKQPGIADVTQQRRALVRSCFQSDPVLLRLPDTPWRAEVSLSSTFVPSKLVPGHPEARALGAVVVFEVVEL
jgi:hypothetical protein